MKKLESSLLNMVVVLTIVTAIAGGLLAFVNNVTAPAIEAINNKKLQDGIKKVLVGETGGDIKLLATDNKSQEGFIIYLTDKGTAIRGFVNGFGGPLEVLVGFDDDGNILGYEILHSAETPGLGVKASFWFQKGGKGDIIGKNPGKDNLTVSKDGGDIDAITASTITSRAFLKAVTNAYDALKKSQGEKKESDSNSGASQRPVSTEELDSIAAMNPEEIEMRSHEADANSGASQQQKH
ncbi:MAG: FMN-binding protein [Bacteroidaceae bacterium]|nr:FMN-binding protein [Bacteroidaceae bacterium]